jgi:hypothetical protein
MLLVQIGFAVHAIRRGYPLFWVFLIIFVPLIGCILYTVMVLLPEWKDSHAARRASRSFLAFLNPDKELKRRRAALDLSDTVGNRIGLAEEYLKRGMLDEAIALYEGSLTGIYRTDPNLLLGLARVLVEAGNFDQAGATLTLLAETNPEFENPEARLLHARTLEQLGATDEALQTYEALARDPGGAEIRCRLALLLKRLGRTAEARAWFEEILKDARAATRHSYRLNREWVDIARRELG